jgi:signal transduction histidine kinase
MIPLAASRTIQSLDEIVWAINPRHDTLESLANYLSRFSQEFLALASVRCLLDVPTVLPQISLSAELRHNLVLASREALQNVVSHARATEVRVALALEDRTLSITIADDGWGFELASVGTEGNGLRNMRKRLEDVGGILAVVSTPGHGTLVTFRIELNPALHGRVVGKPEVGP